MNEKDLFIANRVADIIHTLITKYGYKEIKILDINSHPEMIKMIENTYRVKYNIPSNEKMPWIVDAVAEEGIGKGIYRNYYTCYEDVEDRYDIIIADKILDREGGEAEFILLFAYIVDYWSKKQTILYVGGVNRANITVRGRGADLEKLKKIAAAMLEDKVCLAFIYGLADVKPFKIWKIPIKGIAFKILKPILKKINRGKPYYYVFEFVFTGEIEE